MPKESGLITPWRAWSAVAVLCIAQVVSTVDRGMLALVVDPVRRDLAIGEVDIALLQGFAFAVFYVSVGLPLGYVADRVNRRRLLFGGILVWSAGTLACGLADSFTQMFFARLVIGVGEAVLGPCAVGMIGDMFAPERRGRPMALYVLGSMVAYGLGSMATGAVLQKGAAGGFAGWPVVADLAPWRTAFVLMGLAGLPVALLLLLIAHNRREGDRQAQGASLPFAEMAARWSVLLPLYGGVALFAMGAAAASGWGAALLTRAYGYAPAEVGKQLGAAQMVCSLIGAGLAAFVVDRVAKAGGTPAKLRMSAALALLTIPACMGFASQSGTGALLLTATVMATSALYGTTMLSILAEAVPVQARGLAVAFYAFVMTMIGGSLGPLAVAALTERVFANPARVGWSMGIVGAVALTLSAMLAMMTARAQERMNAQN
jgi:MFS family permease